MLGVQELVDRPVRQIRTVRLRQWQLLSGRDHRRRSFVADHFQPVLSLAQRWFLHDGPQKTLFGEDGFAVLVEDQSDVVVGFRFADGLDKQRFGFRDSPLLSKRDCQAVLQTAVAGIRVEPLLQCLIGVAKPVLREVKLPDCLRDQWVARGQLSGFQKSSFGITGFPLAKIEPREADGRLDRLRILFQHDLVGVPCDLQIADFLTELRKSEVCPAGIFEFSGTSQSEIRQGTRSAHTACEDGNTKRNAATACEKGRWSVRWHPAPPCTQPRPHVLIRTSGRSFGTAVVGSSNGFYSSRVRKL